MRYWFSAGNVSSLSGDANNRDTTIAVWLFVVRFSIVCFFVALELLSFGWLDL